MQQLTQDYVERVYAGVLGKTIGVYLGRPFEGWPYELIQKRLGDVEYYVHDQLNVPLVVTDDDIAGTFTFVRALADHGYSADITSEQIGQSWLNYLIEHKTILWWGGLGNSTEHTAYLRLKSGIAAPNSGSAELNSQVVAEQIGAQIFIDGWAMVSPGDAALAARLATQAARVSHDGEAVHGAVVLAVMEAMAFIESDLHKLIDKALDFIPADSTIRRLIDDLRSWRLQDSDWRANRERLAGQYGYDKYGGNCHMVPNHGLIILSLLHGNDSFSETMKIINTSGWDTDCNSGNVGCLMGIKNGLAGFEEGRDWRGPVADRVYVTAADPSWGVSDCLQETKSIVNTARALRQQPPWQPKADAQYHFDLPGSTQGFTVTDGSGSVSNVSVAAGAGSRGLRFVPKGQGRFGTPVFAPSKELAEWTEQDWNPYPFVGAPRVYPGQTLRAQVLQGAGARVRLYVAYYDDEDKPAVAYAPWETVEDVAQLVWPVPEVAYPAFEVGIETTGAVVLDYLCWDGEPDFVSTRRPSNRVTMRRRAWVNAVDEFVNNRWSAPFQLIQNSGRGLLIQGNREWRNIRVSADMRTNMATCCGVAVRVQGLRRYYAALLHRSGELRLVKMFDHENVLGSVQLDWQHGVEYQLSLTAAQDCLSVSVDGELLLQATDSQLECGGMGLVVEEGCSMTRSVSVQPG